VGDNLGDKWGITFWQKNSALSKSNTLSRKPAIPALFIQKTSDRHTPR